MATTADGWALWADSEEAMVDKASLSSCGVRWTDGFSLNSLQFLFGYTLGFTPPLCNHAFYHPIFHVIS